MQSPLLDFFRRGEAARDIRLLAAQGVFAPRAGEQLAILVHLAGDADEEIRKTAEDTISRIPPEALAAFLARSDVPAALKDFFAARGIAPVATAASSDDDDDAPLIDRSGDVPAGVENDPLVEDDDSEVRLSATQQLAAMTFSQRLKAAIKGTREVRAILVRDPNRVVSTAVLSSPKLTEQEVEAFAKMGSVSEDVLRIIASNRRWMKNYSIVLGLAKNSKTPVAMSMRLMLRLNHRDLVMLSIDRNVPEPLRIAARKKVVASRT